MQKPKKSPKPDQKPTAETEGEAEVSLPIEVFSVDDLMAAVRLAFSSGGPRDRDTAIHDVADTLTFRRVGSKIRETLDSALRTAVRRGIVRNDGQLLHPDCRTIEDYDRDYLVQYLLAVIERTWWEQEDAIRCTANYLGFQRTGSTIHDTLKNTIATAIRRGLVERNGTMIRRCG